MAGGQQKSKTETLLIGASWRLHEGCHWWCLPQYTVLATGKTAYLVQLAIDVELYTYICWPVVSENSRSMNRDS